jgi:hypothetical protein
MRRPLVAFLVIIVAAAAGFGLGYLVGHRATALRPGIVPSVLPRPVLVPKVLHLSMTAAVQEVLDADLAVGKVEPRTGSEPGTIVAQFPAPGTSVVSGTPVNLFVSTSMYPRGWFQWCPDMTGTLPVGRELSEEAEPVALRFSRAFLHSDWSSVRQLLDPSALPLQRRQWTLAGNPNRVQIGSFGLHPPLVAYSCGRSVAQRSAAVALDDGTTSASADFNLYLVRRADGWKVWGSY